MQHKTVIATYDSCTKINHVNGFNSLSLTGMRSNVETVISDPMYFPQSADIECVAVVKSSRVSWCVILQSPTLK